MEQKTIPQRYLILATKWKDGSISPDEAREFADWYNQGQDLPVEIPMDFAQNLGVLEQGMLEEILKKTHAVKTVRLWSRIVAAAAMVLLVVGASIWYFNGTSDITVQNTFVNDVAPGRNAATLTLADGQQISVDDALVGNIAEQQGLRVSKTADGSLVYEVTGNALEDQTGAHILTTARGQQSKVRLPDGSLVFLNAESSLKYAVNFLSSKSREVELHGEGYFEVAHDPSKPFKVISKGQEVKVLGTHFNVNSYAEETAVKTTLLEGSVRVSSLRGTASPDPSEKQSRTLQPNEQSTLSPNGTLAVAQANVEDIVAWTKGKFVFEQEDITSVMRKLARWYNIEVVYQGRFDGKTFTGSISRFDNISKILDKITYTEAVHFKIEGRRVTIMP